MHSEFFDAVPLWLHFPLTCAFMATALECGRRYGRRRRERGADEKEAPVGAMVASILALLAFLLAFTFGLAAGRFEARRQAVLEDANAIGTTYLRSMLLREPCRSESAALLRQYVDNRVNIQEYNAFEIVARSEELHGKLWLEASKETETRRDAITALYVDSLNRMIDMHAVRVQVGIRSWIPSVLWAGLFALSALGMFSVGYQVGLSMTCRSPAMVVLVLAFAGVLYLIADLDRPGEGFLRVGQQAMADVQRGMQPARP